MNLALSAYRSDPTGRDFAVWRQPRRSTYLSRLGRNAEAMAMFEQAEKLVPDDPVIAYNMGFLLTEKRDFERARIYARKPTKAGCNFPLCATSSLSRGSGVNVRMLTEDNVRSAAQ